MYTTRPIRVSEAEGVEYYFVNEERLEELKNQNRIIEHRSIIRFMEVALFYC